MKKKLALFLAAFMLVATLVSPVAAAASNEDTGGLPPWSVTEPEFPPPDPPDPGPDPEPPDPDPDPEPEPPDPDPDPEPEPPDPDPDPDPEPPDPPKPPDPNEPNSPPTITIYEGDVPRTYVKVWDPELEEWVYIPEDEVPLSNMTSPQTGDVDYTGAGWVVLMAAAGVVFWVKHTKKDEAVG